jgi:hypothetical protein
MGGFMEEDLATDAQLEGQGRHPETARFRLVHPVDPSPWWWGQTNLEAMSVQRRGQLLKIGWKRL